MLLSVLLGLIAQPADVAELDLSAPADQPQTVTFTHPCAHSAVVLEALGKELNLILKPSGSVNKDYFLISFDDVPLQEAYDRIAETLNATWTRKGGVTYLGRTRAQDKEDLGKSRQPLIDSIKKFVADNPLTERYGIEEAKRLIEQTLLLTRSPDTYNYAQMMALDVQAPSGRLLLRLLAVLDQDKLAGIEEGSVYRIDLTDPSIALGLKRAYQVFLEEDARHRTVLEAVGGYERASNYRPFTATIGSYGPMYGDHSAVVVEVSRSMTGLTMSATASVKRGSRAVGLARIGNISIRAEAATGSVPPELAAINEPIRRHEAVVEAGQAILSWFGDPTRREGNRLSPESHAFFARPTENEMLATIGSDWIFQSAEALGLNVVASLPDLVAFLPLMAFQGNAETTGQLWGLTAMPDIDVGATIEDGWLLVQPTKPTVARSSRIDRAVVERFIKQFERTHRTSLDPFADLVVNTDSELSMMFSLFLTALGTNEQGMIANLFEFGDINVVRFYGTLSAVERRAARNGGIKIPADRLTARRSGLANRFIFDRDLSVRSLPGDGLSRIHGPVSQVIGTGVPPGTTLTVTVAQKVTYAPKTMQGGAPYAGRSGDLDSLPRQIVAAESQNRPVPDPTFLAKIITDVVTIECLFPSVGVAVATGSVDQFERDRKYFPMTDLGEEWVAKFQANVQMQRKAFAQAGAGKRKVPPPTQ